MLIARKNKSFNILEPYYVRWGISRQQKHMLGDLPGNNLQALGCAGEFPGNENNYMLGSFPGGVKGFMFVECWGAKRIWVLHCGC